MMETRHNLREWESVHLLIVNTGTVSPAQRFETRIFLQSGSQLSGVVFFVDKGGRAASRGRETSDRAALQLFSSFVSVISDSAV